MGILQCGKVHCHLISHSGVWPSINKLCSSTTSASAAMLSMEKVEVFFKDRVSLSSPRWESSQLSGCREQRVGVTHWAILMSGMSLQKFLTWHRFIVNEFNFSWPCAFFLSGWISLKISFNRWRCNRTKIKFFFLGNVIDANELKNNFKVNVFC